MKIEFTSEQYETLVKLAYLGNWVANACRDNEDMLKEYDELTLYINSLCKDFKKESMFDHSSDGGEYYVNEEIEENLSEVIDFYNMENFWQELIDNLARRDILSQYNQESINNMNNSDFLEKLSAIEEKYEEEFMNHRLDRLKIVE